MVDVPDVRVRSNQYRSALEPEDYVLTPLCAAAIFSRNWVVEALLADPTVKVRLTKGVMEGEGGGGAGAYSFVACLSHFGR